MEVIVRGTIGSARGYGVRKGDRVGEVEHLVEGARE